MVEIDKDYVFHGPGEVSLIDLFEGRSQLIIDHFMFDPDWEDGCPSCTAGTEELSEGLLDHLHTRDTALAMVSRAPLEKLERWKAKKGWDIRGTRRRHRLQLRLRGHRRRRLGQPYNFRPIADEADLAEGDESFEAPGASFFLHIDDRVFHTYSQYARGPESTGGSYYFLDPPRSGARRSGKNRRAVRRAREAQPDFAS